MTVTYHHYSHTGSEPPLIILHVVGAADIAAFKELIQRGSNLAPNLPASMKELADLALLGRVLQDYKAQEQRENPVAKTSAISFTMSQGWKLKGGICPVLYSDTINGYGVGRDDLWLATTDALKSAQPVEVQLVPLTDATQFEKDVARWMEKDGLTREQAECEVNYRTTRKALKSGLSAHGIKPTSSEGATND